MTDQNRDSRPNPIGVLLEKGIAIERIAAELYLLFCELFPEDKAFWWRLMLEEQNHAALFESARGDFLPLKKVPIDLVPQSLKDLNESITTFSSIMEQWRANGGSRAEAFNTALRLEESAAELHLQKYAERSPGSALDKIFQRLVHDDKLHAQRIQGYIEEHNIR